MSAPLDGKVDILTAPAGQVTITLDGTTANILAGGSGQSGDVLVRDGDGKVVVRISGFSVATRPTIGAAPNGGIAINDPAGTPRVTLTASGDVVIGGNGADGDVVVKTKDSKTMVTIRAAGSSQGITVRNTAGKEIVALRGDAAENIYVRDDLGKSVFNFVGDAFDNKVAGLWMGTHTADGGKKAALLVLRGRNGNDAIVLNGGQGETVYIRDGANKPVLNFAADAFDGKIAGLWIGAAQGDGGAKPGLVALRDNQGRDSIVVDGAQGDIILNNADCAEDFDVSDAAEPGTVMVIGDHGRLRACEQAYDTKVVGVVSGAGDCRPAIVLGRRPSDVARCPIALNGRTVCRADATYGPIRVGDLLTTSATAGHAMKASDSARAFGAVIGKALAALGADRGLIPILVSLQ